MSIIGKIRIYLLTRKAHSHRKAADVQGRKGSRYLDKADDHIRAAHRIESKLRTLRAAL